MGIASPQCRKQNDFFGKGGLRSPGDFADNGCVGGNRQVVTMLFDCRHRRGAIEFAAQAPISGEVRRDRTGSWRVLIMPFHTHTNQNCAGDSGGKCNHSICFVGLVLSIRRDGKDVNKEQIVEMKPTSPASSRKPGFSVIELLVVLAIVMIMAVFSLVAFNQTGQAGRLTKTSGDIADLLEQARAYAMAQNTYVWVGFSGADNDTLRVGVVASRGGDSNPSPDDLVPLSRVRSFERVRIVSLAKSDERPPAMDDAQMGNLKSAIMTFSMGGSAAVTFDSKVIQFNSRGESRIVSNQHYKIVEIGLQEAIDGQIRNDANYAAIQVRSLSGSVSLYRP